MDVPVGVAILVRAKEDRDGARLFRLLAAWVVGDGEEPVAPGCGGGTVIGVVSAFSWALFNVNALALVSGTVNLWLSGISAC